jgi:hypothetical protein
MKNIIFGLLLSTLYFLPLVSGCSPQTPPSTTPITASTSNSVPPVHLDLKFQGDFPGGSDAAMQEFNCVYPYLVYYLGEPFSIGREGVTWIWDPGITSPGQIGWNAKDNSVKAGPRQGILDPPPFPEFSMYWNLYQQYDHETCHLFYDVGDGTIDFTFGQWIWEAHALVGQALAYAQVYRDGLIGAQVSTYDNISNIGWEQLNGVRTDGDKYNRTIVDSSATTALRLMTEVFAGSSRNEDFVKRINAAIFETYRSSGDLRITGDMYKSILNHASGGQTIDGLSAGDWFFAQPVANVNGAMGTYLIVYPQYSTGPGARLAPNGFELAAFIRQPGQNPSDLHEVGLADQDIIMTVTDPAGKLVKQTTVRTQGDGTGRVEFITEGLPPGAYLVQAKTSYNGEEVAGGNFFIVQSRDQTMVTAYDNRMFIVPLNADGSALRSDLVGKLKIEGGQVESILPGMLVITAEPGKEVVITAGAYKKIVSKPLTARIVPLRVPD